METAAREINVDEDMLGEVVLLLAGLVVALVQARVQARVQGCSRARLHERLAPQKES